MSRIGVEQAHAVGPDEPDAAAPAGVQKLGLAGPALFASFGKAGRDDHNCADALRGALVDDLYHRRGRHRDHSQVDRTRDAGDGCVGGHRLHYLVGADRVHRARELRIKEVAEELAADRAPPPRGAHNGDRSRFEEAPHRGDGGQVVALGKALARRLG